MSLKITPRRQGAIKAIQPGTGELLQLLPTFRIILIKVSREQIY